MMENINLVHSLSRKAALLLIDHCKKNVSEFREVYTSMGTPYIKGILTGRSGEKYTISLYANIMQVEFRIYCISFHDDTDTDDIKNLFYYMNDNIHKDEGLINQAGMENIIKDFW